MNAAWFARRLAAGVLCGLLLPSPYAAGAAATAGFQIAVEMASTSQGTCVSEPLNEPADFQVTCTSGQFVNLSPRPTSAFVGAPGNAFRYHMMRGPPVSSLPTHSPVSREAPASITAMRVSSGSDPAAGPVEILVSF